MGFAVVSRGLVEDRFKGGGVVYGIEDICMCVYMVYSASKRTA